MRWRKRDLWKAGIIVAGVLLLLVLMVWLPVSAAGAYEGASGAATPGTITVQATPTEDATVTVLSKEQLTLQVKQLQNQLQNQNNWLLNNSTALIAALATVVVALFGISQWTVNRRDERRKEKEAQNKELEDRKTERERRDEEQQRWLKNQEAEREKRTEERFQAAVTGLGDDREGAKIGAAILLRTFLRPGHEEFYVQTFDLAVANLRLPRTPHASEYPDGVPYQPKDQKSPPPLTTLSLALIVVFKEAFPLARNTTTRDNERALPSLDATGVQLDNAYLVNADLKQVWMRQASLRETNLRDADLSRADLRYANLNGAHLINAHLSSATLSSANLRSADLRSADLRSADLRGADLRGATLRGANLNGANLRGVEGLDEKLRATCKAKGAIVDEDPTTSSSQSTAAPSPPPPSNDAHPPSTSPAQGSLPTPDAGGSSAASSQQDSES